MKRPRRVVAAPVEAPATETKENRGDRKGRGDRNGRGGRDGGKRDGEQWRTR